MRNPYGPDFWLGYHGIVLGVPGSGKSTLAKKLTKRCGRVVYFDPHGDYDQLPGVEVVMPFDAERMNALLEPDKPVRICIEADQGTAKVCDEFDWLVSYLRWYGNGCVLVADEVGDYKIDCEQTLKRLHRNGHKRGIVTLLVSQRAVDIPLGCRATATNVYSLLQTHENDVKTLHEITSHLDGPEAEAALHWRPPQPPLYWERRRLWGTR